MLILHASYSGNALLLWSEKSLEEDAPAQSRSVSRRAHSHSLSGLKHYPYDAGDELAKSIPDLISSFSFPVKNSQRLVAWFPTRGNSPIPSSTLIAEAPGLRGRGVRTASPWIP